jgi:hypothetical protein
MVLGWLSTPALLVVASTYCFWRAYSAPGLLGSTFFLAGWALAAAAVVALLTACGGLAAHLL